MPPQYRYYGCVIPLPHSTLPPPPAITPIAFVGYWRIRVYLGCLHVPVVTDSPLYCGHYLIGTLPRLLPFGDYTLLRHCSLILLVVNVGRDDLLVYGCPFTRDVLVIYIAVVVDYLYQPTPCYYPFLTFPFGRYGLVGLHPAVYGLHTHHTHRTHTVCPACLSGVISTTGCTAASLPPHTYGCVLLLRLLLLPTTPTRCYLHGLHPFYVTRACDTHCVVTRCLPTHVYARTALRVVVDCHIPGLRPAHRFIYPFTLLHTVTVYLPRSPRSSIFPTPHHYRVCYALPGWLHYRIPLVVPRLVGYALHVAYLRDPPFPFTVVHTLRTLRLLDVTRYTCCCVCTPAFCTLPG